MDQLEKTDFLKEISQQPDALRDLVTFYRADGKSRLEEWARMAKEAGRVYFSGMGTSEFTPQLIVSSLAQSGVDASTIDAGELLHYPMPLNGILVLVSQSGESVEPRKIAESLDTDAAMIAIVNYEDSTIAKLARLVLPLCAGAETTITTKTYVNTMALLHLMACALSGDAAIDKALTSIEALAGRISEYDYDAIERAAELLQDAACIHFISRGPAIAAAKQASLTFMEGTQTSATPFAAGAFRHGPFELVDASHRCVFFIPQGRTADLLSSMAQEVASMGSHVVAITNCEVDLNAKNSCILIVPDAVEELFPVSAATIQELLLDALARKRGVEAGHFRHGGKVTERE